MSTLAQRLNKIMSENGINQTQLSKIACTTPQNVNNWINRGKISRKKALLIAVKFGYDPDWIVNGIGENVIDSKLNAVEWESLSREEQIGGRFITIPVLDVELSPETQENNRMYTLPFRAETLKERGIPFDMAKIVEVSGNSMEPRLFDRDIISINMADTRIRDGKIYAVRGNELQKIKMLIRNSDGSIILRSFNPAYPDEIISREQITNGEFEVLGRMWWHSSLDD